MQKDTPNKDIDYENSLFYPFFWYGLRMFAESHISDLAFNDIILLAKTYEDKYAAYNIVMEEDLPEELFVIIELEYSTRIPPLN